jgi:Zn-finger nucleic acid-binding protein
MIAAERHGIEVDVCARGHGLWFDSGEIELLAETLALPAPELRLRTGEGSDEKKRRCPRCDAKMAKAYFSAADAPLIDACPATHGFWFDKGELGGLFARTRPAGSQTEAAMVAFLGELLEG